MNPVTSKKLAYHSIIKEYIETTPQRNRTPYLWITVNRS